MTIEFSDDFTVVDRSTLERFADCPMQGRLDEKHKHSLPGIAWGGQEIHEAISRTIQIYIDSSGVISPFELKQEMESQLWSARSDLQPEAIRGFSRSIYAFAQYLSEIHFENILRFDGGEGMKSGQLAWDFDTLKVCVTSEVDFLHSTPSPSLLSEIDWKTGWKKWTEEDVRSSFQFQLHAFLVLMNYPEVEALRVVIWNTRHRTKTWDVDFRRDQLEPIRFRIMKAIENWWKFRSMEIEDVPAWPVTEKCELCDYAIHCPVADGEIVDVNNDPQAFVEQMVVLTQRLDSMKKAGKSYVKLHGDIWTLNGDAFGFDKPQSKRKVLAFYSQKED
jgi:hypothetical protein